MTQTAAYSVASRPIKRCQCLQAVCDARMVLGLLNTTKKSIYCQQLVMPCMASKLIAMPGVTSLSAGYKSMWRAEELPAQTAGANDNYSYVWAGLALMRIVMSLARCASWGWFGPLNTLRWLNSERPRRPLGSMPLIACSTILSGMRCTHKRRASEMACICYGMARHIQDMSE